MAPPRWASPRPHSPDLGATVLATTRRPERLAVLAQHGVDHPILDDGRIVPLVCDLIPGGVDATLELVGPPTLRDSLQATRLHETVCSTGMVSHQFVIPAFYPINFLPRGVTAYAGGASDLPQAGASAVPGGRGRRTILRTATRLRARPDPAAHLAMETNQVAGKLVVRVSHRKPDPA